jgi:hypothetical protein
MYTLKIKDTGTDLDIIMTRSMLGLASIAAVLYRTQGMFFLNLLSALLLLLAAIFIKVLLTKFSINKMLLLVVAALLLFFSTHSVAFAFILMAYGYLAKFLNVQPTIAIANDGVLIKKLLSNTLYPWTEFSNVILKDDLLTLDFKTNKLIQLSIEDRQPAVDEKGFNEFCNAFV